MPPRALSWINKLNLLPHPEGGHYKEVYRSADIAAVNTLPKRFSGPRSFSTSIYFLLSGSETSSLHKIASDELWHHYDGSALEIIEIDLGGGMKIHQLGSNVDSDQLPQLMIPHGSWFGARVKEPNSFALVGCTVSPGFDFEDFVLADNANLPTKLKAHRDAVANFYNR